MKIYEKEEKDKKLSPVLEDGGSIILKCSNCDNKLVEVWRTRPNEKLGKNDVIWKLRAICCYCGDKSYPIQFKGGFHYKGIGKVIDKTRPEDEIDVTKVINAEPVGDEVVFYTEKAK